MCNSQSVKCGNDRASGIGWLNRATQTTAAKLSSNDTNLQFINVIIHVLYHNDFENIDNATIHNQISELNDAFSGRVKGIENVPTEFASLVANTNISFRNGQLSK